MPQESESLNLNDLFSQALVLQQQKNLDGALTAYQKLLDQSQGSLGLKQASVVYHNMSTIAAEKTDLLKAYVWSKKALTLDSDNQFARQSFEHYAKKFEIPNISHQISNLDTFKKIISKGPVDVWLVLSLILIFTTLWLFVKKLILNKKNKLNDIFQNTSMWSVYILSILTTLVIITSIVRYFDSQITRAIVIGDKTQVQTAPGENKPVIFEAQAGLEIEVLNFNNSYFQIRYPGAFSGWVNKSQIELLSLTFEQAN